MFCLVYHDDFCLLQNELMLLLCFVWFQQAEVIRERTGYQVGHYCGEMGQDFWDARRWQREFETKQVFFEVFSRSCI